MSEQGIPVSEHLFARRRTRRPRNSGVRASFREAEDQTTGIPVKEFRCQSIFSRGGGPDDRNSGVRASFRVADDHDSAAHGRCRGNGK